MENSTIEEKNGTGLTGLANLGNTCFMNAALQCLVHSDIFNRFLETKKYEKKLNKKIDSLILLEYDKLRKMMWSEDCLIGPGGFLSSVQKVAKIKDRVLFTGFAQNDITEFLIFLIDCFHTAISREVEMEISGKVETDTDKMAESCYKMLKTMYSKEYSEILDMFYGISISEITSLDNKKILSSTPESFLLLDLALPERCQKNTKNTTLGECIDCYIKTEHLKGDNSYELNDNTKVEANKRLKFWKLPDILIITLKRFSNGSNKNQSCVDFPLANLDMSKYIVGYNKEDFVYDLYGICNHEGGILGGHYYANIKNRNGKWYCFNDGDVEEIKDNSKLITPYGYCFFYCKKK